MSHDETLVCGDCGLEVVVRGDDRGPIHIGVPGEGWQSHDVSKVLTWNEYVSGVETRRAENRSPGERQATALERIANALERIADRP